MKIAIFYHILQVGDWEKIYCEQMARLQESGLLQVADRFHIGINGDKPLPFTFSRDHTISRNNNIRLEYETLKHLYDFCVENDDYRVLYFNALGVNWSEKDWYNNKVPVPNGYLLYGVIGENKVLWRKYLEYFNIDNWQTCVKELNNYDCVGAELLNYGTINNEEHNLLHFSGNFWWTKSDYVRKLNPNFMLEYKYDRYNCEFWIGTGNPKCKSFFNYNKNLYDQPIYEHEYMTMFKNKNTAANGRICMISMFKNESRSIANMLESVAPYIDYWVLQDNGSTDGTPQVVEDWAKKYNIPGFMYKVEEGWVGYGWNRDHVLLQARSANHNCQWIMKMDCDETLDVDDDFDWSVLNDHNPQGYDVHAWSPGCQYFRTWMWRADLPWRINHDPAHETVYIDDGVTGENFSRGMLPLGFKMKVGSIAGESYQNPTKYVSDALKLEEKMIREGTMLKDLYHFWYIGKSYEDGYVCNAFPLGDTHKREYARRCIWYFEEILNVTHPGFKETRKAVRFDEMGYYAMDVMGTACKFLGEHYKAIEYYEGAEQFSPQKNDHLVHLAEIYWELLDFDKMLKITTRLVDPNRTNPFPNLGFVINPHWYVNTGTHPQFLHNVALEHSQSAYVGTIFSLDRKLRKKLFVVDNFYENPDLVRKYALQQEFNGDLRFYKGKRTISRHSTPQIKQRFEEIMGEKITRWDTPSKEFGGSMNGVFQYCTPEDLLVYHYDSQKWAAMIFLTPDAPPQTGTSFYRHKETGIKVAEDQDADRAFTGGFYDSTKFELIDTVGNIYNRCVIFDARSIHAATEYFGQTKEDSRLFQIFFFD